MFEDHPGGKGLDWKKVVTSLTDTVSVEFGRLYGEVRNPEIPP